MANIIPFKALRPSTDWAAAIAALPYDVYNRQEAYAQVQKCPDSFLAIDRPETAFEQGHDIYAPEVYKKAREILKAWTAEGRFIREEKPCYYIYELIMDGRSQTGIVACSAIKDYEKNIIKKHENTRADKEKDRIKHVDALNAQTGPIFLAYRANETLSQIVDRVKKDTPLYAFTSEDNITHNCWIIEDDETISSIRDTFASINSIYIADGHHRAASAVKVGQERRQEAKDNEIFTGNEDFNYFLSVLFPDDQLKIMDYNRVVKDLGGLKPEELIDVMGKMFIPVAESDEPIAPDQKGRFSMYIQDKWYCYDIREEDKVDDPVQGLDVALLQELVLEPFLNIQDPKTDSRIDFVGGIRGLKELERRVHTDCAVAFAMHPTSINELFEVADASMLMPPKSTWFEPKLRSGLFIHEI